MSDKKCLLFVIALIINTSVLPARNVIDMSDRSFDCAAWTRKAFARGGVPPFSFVCDGVPSSEFLSRWRYAAHEMAPGRQAESLRAYFWTDPRSGLQAEVRVKLFDDFNAMEWVLLLRNTGEKDSPRISEVRTVDLRQHSREGEWTLFHAHGPYFGRDDFQPCDTLLAVSDSVRLTADKGRSSSHTMPYFNLLSPDGGMVFAAGWTGNWLATVERTDAGEARVGIGLRTFDSYLRPGEEVRLASALMIPWQGTDRMDGQNILRRLILAHHHPMADGRPVKVPILSDFGGPGPWPCDETACMTDFLAQAVVRETEFLGTLTDGFWMDAGWYSRAGDWQHKYWWHSAVGNWTPDPVRYPDGMAPLADAIHSTGGKFLLWYEPERANVDSDWAHAHPEWMLAESGEPAVPLTEVVDSAFIVNMGDPEALSWVKTEMLRSLTDNKVDIYRQDFNIDPELFWINNDEPGRAGMCEVKYINGLYSYLDYLHEQLPFLIIDNCAGGGRRLDFEMLSRGVSLWRSDYSMEVEGRQCHTYNLHQWIPVHCASTGSPDPWSYRSALSPGGNITFGIYDRRKAPIDVQLRVIDLWREMYPYLLADYYPLSGYGDLTGNDVWIAYQFHKPDDGSGRVLAFRRKVSKESQYVVKLRGLDPEAVYHLSYDLEEQPSCDFTGRELMSGLTLTLGKPLTSLLIRYQVNP